MAESSERMEKLEAGRKVEDEVERGSVTPFAFRQTKIMLDTRSSAVHGKSLSI
jgi:hypothetical protein